MRRSILAVCLAAIVALPAYADGPRTQSGLGLIAPTAPPGDNTNRIATTAFVQAASGGSLALASGKIFVGSAGNIATAQTMSGDGTLSIAGALTLATVSANVGAFGSSTQCVTMTNNAKGLTTAISAATCTPAIGSITGLGTGVAAALAANVNASGGIVTPTPTRAGDLIYWNGSTWATLAGNNSGTQILQENASGVPSWVTVSGTGTVTSVVCGSGLTGGTITTSGTCANDFAVKADMQTPTSTVKVVNPRDVQDHPGVAKVVASFDGSTGACSGGCTIGYSYNVSGTITRASVGNYTVNYTTACTTANYAFNITFNSPAVTVGGFFAIVSKAAGSINFTTRDTANALADFTVVNLMVWCAQ